MIPSGKTPNRLLKEKSPYLQQHAYNPVDWYPWGEEAFERARRENKPILVSIGYSTCHWCHVMERESYEDAAVAALMNHYLINIKVDREERPDVDKIYMTAVSAMTGQGGWPLNIFLTPALQPIYGGTYFPPESRWGQPAWREVVTQIGQSWLSDEHRTKMQGAAQRITESLKQYVTSGHDPVAGDPGWIDEGVKSLKSIYDAAKGGFGSEPKFPMPVYYSFLFRAYARNKNGDALAMALNSLRAMAKGGIRDHLAGGFARYSTDSDWHIPHFEKMLYDNAQLAVNYVEAFQLSGDASLREVAQEILGYLRRVMTHPDGGFYSAEDADSLPRADAAEKTEGAFYVWEYDELLRAAGEKAGRLFAFRYGAEPDGNAKRDPHGEFVRKNILFEARSLTETAAEFQLSEEETGRVLDEARRRLSAEQSKRPRPHLDDKVLSAWNGLAISAFAKAYQVLRDPVCLQAAQRAARFLRARLYDPGSRTLYRRWREGERRIEGLADDYAFVAQGLVDLYEADFDRDWLAWATELVEEMGNRFYDRGSGGFYMTRAGQGDLLLRIKEDMDNVEPAASSVAAMTLLRLGQILDRRDFLDQADSTLKAFAKHLQQAPRGLPYLLCALDFQLTEPRQIVIAGDLKSDDTQALLHTVWRRFLPVKTLRLAEAGSPYQSIDGKATAYACIRHACQAPATDPDTLDAQLAALQA